MRGGGFRGEQRPLRVARRRGRQRVGTMSGYFFLTMSWVSWVSRPSADGGRGSAGWGGDGRAGGLARAARTGGTQREGERKGTERERERAGPVTLGTVMFSSLDIELSGR